MSFYCKHKRPKDEGFARITYKGTFRVCERCDKPIRKKRLKEKGR